MRNRDKLSVLAVALLTTCTQGINAQAQVYISTDGTTVSGDYVNDTAGTQPGGGGVYNAAKNVTVENAYFYNNTSPSQADKSGYGGGYANGATSEQSSTKVIKNSKFVNNSAYYVGGAIANYNIINEGIVNVVFEGNKTTYVKGTSEEYDITHGQGGAISNSGQINGEGVKDSTFTNNEATRVGGAIMNWGNIASITNTTFTGNKSSDLGGALYNAGSIPTITNSAFTNNSVTNGYGGAIAYRAYGDSDTDRGTTDTIANTTFEGNTADAAGGAIYVDGYYDDDNKFVEEKSGRINEISYSTFKNNSARVTSTTTSSTNTYGGAICNDAVIGKISNTTFSANTATSGGAIANSGKISSISNSTFDSNTANEGAAITNTGIISEINDSTFSNNTMSDTSSALGAISNFGTISNIKNSKFYNNSVKATDTSGNAYGGAIYNSFTDSDIKISNSTFENNKVEAADALGGAIYAYGLLDIKNSTFKGNSVTSTGSFALGGAVAIAGNTTNTFTDTDFTNNTVTNNSLAEGAAIYAGSGATININAVSKNVLFSDNKANNKNNDIYLADNNTLNINSAEGRSITFNGGITDGILNSTVNINTPSENTTYEGEVIFNEKIATSVLNLNGGTITTGITNYEKESGKEYILSNLATKTLTVKSGVIDLSNDYLEQVKLDNLNIIGNTDVVIDADLNLNESDAFYPGAIAISTEGQINIVNMNIINDSTSVTVGDTIKLPFIYANDLANKTQSFDNLFTSTNSFDANITYDTNTNLTLTKTATGGGLVNATAFAPSSAGTSIVYNVTEKDGEILINNLSPFNANVKSFILNGNDKDITSENHSGFTIGTGQEFEIDTVNQFSGFSSQKGGVVYNNGGLVDISATAFDNNKASGDGGAIYTTGELTLTDVAFSNNTANGKGDDIYAKDTTVIINASNSDVTFTNSDNSIYLDTTATATPATLNLNAANGKTISLSSVNGSTTGYTININKNLPDGGTVKVNKAITNATAGGGIHMYGGNLQLANDTFINNNALSLHGGSVDMMNNSVAMMQLQSLNLYGSTNLAVDVDLANANMDRISAGAYNFTEGAQINVSGMHILSDANNKNTDIIFTGSQYNNAQLSDKITSSVSYTVNGPVNKYTVTSGQDGTEYKFNFERVGGGGGGGDVDTSNPIVFAGPVAAQLGGYANQLNLYQTAFSSLDMLTGMTPAQRQAIIEKNKLAAAQAADDELFIDAGTKQTYSPTNAPVTEDPGVWFKPYTSIESVPLDGGPKVTNFMYGALVGGDSGLKELGQGWQGIFNGFAGYIGSNQSYDGIKNYQNGGTVGLSGMLFKNNFFGGLTANFNYSGVSSNSDAGTDNFGLLGTGGAMRFGYNWCFKDGKIVLQPNFDASYSFISTGNYTNAYGSDVSSNGLHAVQIAPGLKVIGNLKNNWQVYLACNYKWNLMDKTHFTVADVGISDVSIKPYIEYGGGVQKRFGKYFTGYGEVMGRNIGRNGIAFGLGARWDLGKD